MIETGTPSRLPQRLAANWAQADDGPHPGSAMPARCCNTSIPDAAKANPINSKPVTRRGRRALGTECAPVTGIITSSNADRDWFEECRRTAQLVLRHSLIFRFDVISFAGPKGPTSVAAGGSPWIGVAP